MKDKLQTLTEGGKKTGRQSLEVSNQTKEKILEVAGRIFSQRSFEGVSLRDIAAEAGITHGLLRHHFGTKEEIWRKSVDFAMLRYSQAITPFTDQIDKQFDAVETAKNVLRGFIRTSAENPEIIRLIMHEGTQKGERIEYILHQFTTLGDTMSHLLTELHKLNYLQQFDNQTFFLFLLGTAAMPFALTGATSLILQDDITLEAQVENLTEQIFATLFGNG